MNTTRKIIELPSVSLKVGLLTLLALSLAGCDGLAKLMAKPDAKAEEPPVAEAQQTPAPAAEAPKPLEKPKKMSAPLYEWNSDGHPVTRIVINTDQQKARFYAGDKEIGWSMVATGVASHPTPTGKFQVTEKIENKRSNLYGKVYGKGGTVIRTNAKAGHDPVPDGGRFEGATMPYFLRLTGDGVGLHAGPIPRPGQPASHGCIRLPRKLAPVLFTHVSNGTSVTIEGKGPGYADYLTKQRAIAAQQAADEKRLAARRAAKTAPQVAAAPKVARPAPAVTVSSAAIESSAQAKDTTTAVQPATTAAPQPTAPTGPTTAATATPASEASQPPAASPASEPKQAPATAPAADASNHATAQPVAATAATAPPAVQPAAATTASAPAPVAPAQPEAKAPVAATAAPAPAPAKTEPSTPAPQASKPEPAAAQSAQPAAKAAPETPAPAAKPTESHEG